MSKVTREWSQILPTNTGGSVNVRIIIDSEEGQHAILWYGKTNKPCAKARWKASTEQGNVVADCDMFYVRDPFQGVGNGRKLFKQLTQIAKAQGVKLLYVVHVLPHAQSFWKKMGFVETDSPLVWKKKI